MHFIKITHRAHDDQGLFYACSLELLPLLSNDDASVALYVEMWHRLRRDRFFKHTLWKIEADFDASLYFRGQIGSGQNVTNAALMLNSATGIKHFALDHENAEDTAIKSLRRMDRLLTELLADNSHELQLESITNKFAAGNCKSAEMDLKNLLKIFCRRHGLFVDEADVARASAQMKARRREQFHEAQPRFRQRHQ